MNFREKAQIVRMLALFPALSILVFIRARVGLRLLKANWLFGLTAILVAGALAFHSAFKPFPAIAVIYPLAMLTCGLVQRHRRWRELVAGKRWHTFSPGIGYIELLKWPMWFRTQRRIPRFIEPAGIALVALLVGIFLSHGLGAWLGLTALGVFTWENDTYEKALNRELDMLDSLFSSEVQAELVEIYDGAQMADQPPLTLIQTAGIGIPTGMSQDIAKQIALRRAKQRKAAPNNLTAASPARL